jgi:7TM diverse intracellular signalling
VERYQGAVAKVLEPAFLRAQASSQQGFTASSAASMPVTRGRNTLWRMRFEQLKSQAAPSAIDNHMSQVASSAIDNHMSQVARSAIDNHMPQVAPSAIDNHASSNSDVLLTISNSFDRDVVLYFPPEFKAETYNLFDLRVPTLHSRFSLALALPAQLKAGDAFFMAIHEPTAAPLEVQLYSRHEYAYRDLNLVRLHSAVMSMLIASCGVALCFFLILGERVWLYFMAYIFSVMGYVLTRTGELLSIVNSMDFGRNAWQMATVFALLTPALMAFFLIEFCKLKDLLPNTARALKLYAFAFLILTGLALFPAIRNSNALSITANMLLLFGIFLTLQACLVGVIASNAKLNTADALIDAADQALYLAKSRGRNRVETIDLVSLVNHQKEAAV